MRAFLLLLVIFLGANAGAIIGQGAGPTAVGLIAHYPFDGDFSDATGDSANFGVASGVPEFGCGVEGMSLLLNGGNDFVRIPGGNTNNVNREFDSEDFTLSLYFKSIGFNGTQYLVSKRDTNCNNLQFFSVRYAPITRTVSVILQENNQVAQIDHRITNGSCWQHIAIVRDENRVRLYLNAEEVGQAGTSSRVNIENNGELLIGSTECRNNGEVPFDGLIDEVRIYNRALRLSEVRGLYAAPDQIATEDGRVFLGESIDVSLNSNCGITFNWTPADDVVSPMEAQPTITPSTAGRQAYLVRITDLESTCTALDSLVLQVIDPDLLDCGEVFLPKAFTPNGIGPTANEEFGISNPFAISELLSFEIYDRYGGQMFQTTDVFTKWDGTFKGEPAQPGPIVWRVVFRCDGQELTQSGSAMILR
ncbi:MAG: LamG-like jellyroll fold domain-containing protein [Bacteroidota bacterium]